MELSILFKATLFIMTTLSITSINPCLSLDEQGSDLQVLSASHRDYHHQQVNDDKESLTKLPRKLMNPINEVETINVNAGGHINGDYFKHVINQNEVLSPGHVHNHGMMDGRKGTRQHWVESNTWQYFTMDYAHVRRRRPIHNKFVPLARP